MNQQGKRVCQAAACGSQIDSDEEFCGECGTRWESALPPGMKICISCQKIIPVRKKFCPKCGASQNVKKKRNCCGEDLSSEDEFCGNCGQRWSETSLGPVQMTSSNQPQSTDGQIKAKIKEKPAKDRYVHSNLTEPVSTNVTAPEWVRQVKNEDAESADHGFQQGLEAFAQSSCSGGDHPNTATPMTAQHLAHINRETTALETRPEVMEYQQPHPGIEQTGPEITDIPNKQHRHYIEQTVSHSPDFERSAERSFHEVQRSDKQQELTNSSLNDVEMETDQQASPEQVSILIQSQAQGAGVAAQPTECWDVHHGIEQTGKETSITENVSHHGIVHSPDFEGSAERSIHDVQASDKQQEPTNVSMKDVEMETDQQASPQHELEISADVLTLIQAQDTGMAGETTQQPGLQPGIQPTTDDAEMTVLQEDQCKLSQGVSEQEMQSPEKSPLQLQAPLFSPHGGDMQMGQSSATAVVVREVKVETKMRSPNSKPVQALDVTHPVSNENGNKDRSTQREMEEGTSSPGRTNRSESVEEKETKETIKRHKESKSRLAETVTKMDEGTSSPGHTNRSESVEEKETKETIKRHMEGKSRLAETVTKRSAEHGDDSIGSVSPAILPERSPASLSEANSKQTNGKRSRSSSEPKPVDKEAEPNKKRKDDNNQALEAEASAKHDGGVSRRTQYDKKVSHESQTSGPMTRAKAALQKKSEDSDQLDLDKAGPPNNHVLGTRDNDSSDKRIKEGLQPGNVLLKTYAETAKQSSRLKNPVSSKLTESYIKVTFKVVIGKEFDFDPKKHKVYLKFGAALLGGWNGPLKHVMNIERELEENYFLLVYTLGINKDLLTRGGIEYKYLLHTGYEQEWEYIFQKKSSYLKEGEHVNRKLALKLLEAKDMEFYYKHDIIMFPHPSKLAHKKFFLLGTYLHYDTYKKLEMGRIIGSHAMLKEWSEFFNVTQQANEDQGSNFLRHVSEVQKAMQTYLLTADYLQPDFPLINKVLEKFFSEGLQILSSLVETDDKTIEQESLCLALALAAVFMIISCNFKPEDRFLCLVCRGLLLQPRTDKNQPHAYETVLNNFYKSYKGKSGVKLTEFIKLVMEKRRYEWLFAIPLNHFLTDQCNPYDIPREDARHNDEGGRWWGLTAIENELNRFKRLAQIEIPLDYLVSKLKPLYEMDYLLPRTLAATLTYKQLYRLDQHDIFTPEIYLGMLYYELLTSRLTSMQELIPKFLECVQHHVTLIRSNLADETYSSSRHAALKSIQECCRISFDLLTELVKQTSYRSGGSKINHIHNVAYTCSSSLRLLWELMEAIPSSRQELEMQNCYKDYRNIQDNSIEHILYWLYNILPANMYCIYKRDLNDANELQVWSQLLTIAWPESDLQNRYMHGLQELLKTRIGRLDNYDKIHLYSREDYNNLHPVLVETISEYAFSAVQNICQKSSFQYTNFDTTHLHRISNIMSKVFLSAWPKKSRWELADGIEPVLKHILQWPSMTNYMNLFFDKNRDLLTQECKNVIMSAVCVLEEVTGMLVEGKMYVAYLRKLTDNEKTYLEMCGLVMSFKPNFGKVPRPFNAGTPATEVLQMILTMRKQELQEFSKVRSLVNILLTMCKNISPVDTAELEKKEHINPDTLFLHQMCHPRQYQIEEDGGPIRITYFGLPDSVYAMLEPLSKYEAFILFKWHWERAGTAIRQNQPGMILSLEQVFTNIWRPSVYHTRNICEIISNGEIKLLEVEKLMRKFTNQIHKLKAEIQEISLKDGASGDMSWIDRRFKQFEQYKRMKYSESAAKAILQICKVFDLQGDFSDVHNLLAAVSDENKPLNCIGDEVVQAGNRLHEVKDTQLECMRSFMKAKDLVLWLREHLPRGTQEVKVLVDLAMIRAAGQGDLEVNRVSCLHLAVTGYAPLIYGLHKDAGFLELVTQLEEVWRVLDNDNSLPAKLDEVSTHLHWLQDVHKAHGDVEVNALELAATINARGVYSVGKLSNMADKHMSVETVIHLRIPSDTENKEDQHLGWKDLHDLQSKLMLVAGKAAKGKDEVDRFSQIFDGIIKLGSTFVKMCEAGSVLFKDWNARFYCNKYNPVCVQMDFDLVERKIIGHSGKGIDVMKHLDEICEFMESCLKDWLEYIQNKRSKYYELNYFTMSQLVILRNEIAKLLDQKQPDARVYQMLHIMKPACRERDVEQALEFAWQELKAGITEDITDTTDINQLENNETQFLHNITEEGFPQKLAIKAMRKFGTEKLDEALAWCAVEGDSDTDESQDEVMQVDKSWAWIQENLLSETDDEQYIGKKSLKPMLENVWKKFLSASTSSFKDYLSVEHLAVMLKHLRMQGKSDMKRQAPKHLVKGKPNVVVCPAGEVINVVLSIYYQDSDKPLPMRDEVLYCSDYTTQEEVDLLWRRAVGDTTGRIYCAVFVDQLTYNVSESAAQKLEQLIKDAHGYYLVMVCASEGETKSQLLTAFDNCRIGSPYSMPDQIGHYLKKKFCQAEPAGKIWPASELDPERNNVRLVKSERSGMGKSLYVQRLADKLTSSGHLLKRPAVVTLPLHQRHVQVGKVLSVLLEHVPQPGQPQPRVYHLDIAYEVLEGVDYLLFNLLVLGSLSDKDGYVWQRSPLDLYIIETLPRVNINTQDGSKQHSRHVILQYLPSLTCRSPRQSLEILQGLATEEGYQPQVENWSEHDQKMDQQVFVSEAYQRVSQYLRRLDTKADMNTVDVTVPEGNKLQCLQILLKYFGVKDPSWSELQHFVAFLDKQLKDLEKSIFCSDFFAQDLPGFRAFVLEFMLQMSNDFATRSLKMSEETPGLVAADAVLNQYEIRRRWEKNPHPFLFFNDDKITMTFLGFNIDRASGNVIDPQTQKVIKNNIMTQHLFDALIRNRVNLNERFDDLPRDMKIEKLCKVMGIPDEDKYDPDNTYELTTDNVKKILAIQMRFRCGIPVVLMGETGCGKTRLIQFMCELQKPPGSDINNLIKMKTHGGTTEKDIRKKVREAEKAAEYNMQCIINLRGEDAYIQTVLFFDEANTTEAIGLIKEIMVDKRLDGQPLKLKNGLKIVAACNPYRRHSPEMVKKLEQAGLGYYVKADVTKEKLGEIPMRQLVYRVQALPQSLLPLVWDFGQLNTNTEQLYIKQIVIRFLTEGENFAQNENLCNVISSILAQSQEYIRRNKDECIFVSLRDVERVMRVMMWFYKHRNILLPLMDEKLRERKDLKLAYTGENRRMSPVSEAESDEEDEEDNLGVPDPLIRALILALGVCYVACLENRQKYLDYITDYFKSPCELKDGANTIKEQIQLCQDVFVENVQVADDIARNLALKENLFMMVVCIELRIPLFLVGKPGSSKSLARTIVDHALEGRAAKTELYRNFKQAHMISFQCSRLSTADGIVGTFNQCAKLQENKKDNLDEFVSVVILDEVGLAEDSPHMPLKTLHPLLEDGCIGDEKQERYKKVAFIGISNWALDPAKTNRGILLQRGVPKEEELYNTARGICGRDNISENIMSNILRPLTAAYWELYTTGLKHRSEFFGLRDFYSVVKMLLQQCHRSKDKYNELSWRKVQHAIWRNFDGLETLDGKEETNPIKIFERHLGEYIDKTQQHDDDPMCSNLVSDGLSSDGRYLLILTERDAPLDLLQQQIPDTEKTIVIYGSSFPRDQEYTQVCRNINLIKMCMEAGRTIILHNLENLYESLYDALNQYYIIMGSNRFVDLGLGTQRVKCIVHKDFRLVVVAQKEVVYEKFSIPLINRLEKHFLHISSMLNLQQQDIVDHLQEWAHDMARISGKKKVEDLLVGYHVDAPASVLLQVSKDLGHLNMTPDIKTTVENECQEVLLQCADPEGVMQLLMRNYSHFATTYFEKQSHSSLADYLHRLLVTNQPQHAVFAQVTTYSKLLSSLEKETIARKLGMEKEAVFMQSLQAFNTEQQFVELLRHLYLLKKEWDRVLILQCDTGNEYGQLVACARHVIMNTYKQCQDETDEKEHIGKTHIILVIQLPRIKGGCFISFQGGTWNSAHVDDLRPSPHPILVQELIKKSIRELVEDAVRQDAKCRNYLTATRRKAVNVRVAESKNVVLDESVYDDMPPLEEPDEDVNVYRPDRDVAARVDATDMEAAAHDEDAAEAEMDVDEEYTVPEGGVLNLHQLLYSCCSKATTMLRDIEHQHTLERIHTVKKLFPEPQNITEYSDFAVIMQMRLLELLQEKEERSGGVEVARKWLLNAMKNVSEAGTFRRAWMSYIEQQVAPLLAGLLQFLDTNNNMRIFEKTPPDWRHKLWLDMVSKPAATVLHYKDMLNVKDTLPEEFMVRMTSYTGSLMSASLPFSWIIKEMLDNMLVQTKASQRDGQESNINKTFHMTEIGKCLEKAYEEVGQSTVVELYFQDYLQMVYRVTTVTTQDKEQEYNLIKEMIKTAHNTLKKREELTLTDIHEAFDSIQKRLQNLTQLLSVFPEVLAKIHEIMTDSASHPLYSTSEMAHDVICVETCIDQLNPKSKEMQNADLRQTWLLKVELLQPVLNRIIDNLLYSPHDFGPACRKYAQTLRCKRDKVKCMYLFYKHIQPPQIRDDPMTKAKIPIWTLLGDDCDFKTMKTMKNIKKVLRICSDNASRAYLKIKEMCGVCEGAMQDPVKFPCGHIFCLPCVHDLQAADDNRCPTCQKQLPNNFKVRCIPELEDAREAHRMYKQRCNTFFVELISQLCFVGQQPVEEEVIEMLLSCVTRQSKLQEAQQKENNTLKKTKQLNVLDDCIDPTPVVRSLLLQLLLRARVEGMEKYMESYFRQAQQFLENDNDEQLLQLCLLFVHSCQDTYYYRCTNVKAFSTHEMEMLKQYMEEVSNWLEDPGLSMRTLDAIGRLRFCLDKIALYLHAAYIQRKDIHRETLQQLLFVTESVCRHNNSRYIRWYLVRQFVRKAGLESVVSLLQKHPKLLWILPPTISLKDFCQPHQLSIYGEPFQKLREGIRSALYQKDGSGLVKVYNKMAAKERKLSLYVAMYVEVTLSVAEGTLDCEDPRQIEELTKSLGECNTDANDELVQGLLNNHIGQQCPMLNINPKTQSVAEQGLAALVTHFIMVMATIPDNSLTTPLKNIVSKPQTMKDTLLPTMPQDDLVEIYETMAKEFKAGWDAHKNFGIYRCPNQHIFMVNNCGHLTEDKSKCPTCKAPIGGAAYNKPLPGVTNVKPDEIKDSTQKGHCLGTADKRTTNPYPERKLNRTSMTVLRLLVHIAMYAGANKHPLAIKGMISPACEGSVAKFVLDHLQCDIDILCKCLNHSREDIILLIHILLKHITQTANIKEKFSLDTKQDREKWEEAFAHTYLNQVLNNIDTELQQAMVILSGKNESLKKLYEQEEDDVGEDNKDENEDSKDENKHHFDNIFSLSSLWRYKSQINLNDVANKLDEYRARRVELRQKSKVKNKKKAKKYDPEDCDVLYNFIEKEPQLSAIKYLPSITRLVRQLTRENHRRLYFHEAKKVTLERWLRSIKDNIQRSVYSSLIDDYAAAWEIVRPMLSSFNYGGLTVPKEYTMEPIRKDRTVLAMLLPSVEGRGVCATGLIHYLARLQNDFLSTLPGANMSEGAVSMEEVFPSNLIIFDADKDLLTMFLTHCNYSLEVGKLLQISYNFPALQRQLEERLLRGIPLLEIKIEHMVFKEDLTNATKLENLNDIIKQEYLAVGVAHQIEGELRHLADITECLLMLDIALGFLVSFSNQMPNRQLMEFLQETLCLNTSHFPHKVHQACELRHVKALWLLLAHGRAKILSKTPQDPFERVSHEYQEELSKDEKEQLEALLPHLNADTFLAELHECILLQITKPEDMHSEGYTPKWKHKLTDILSEYINCKDEPPEIPVLSQGRFPSSITAAKCIDVWRFIFNKTKPFNTY